MINDIIAVTLAVVVVVENFSALCHANRVCACLSFLFACITSHSQCNLPRNTCVDINFICLEMRFVMTMLTAHHQLLLPAYLINNNSKIYIFLFFIKRAFFWFLFFAYIRYYFSGGFSHSSKCVCIFISVCVIASK